MGMEDKQADLMNKAQILVHFVKVDPKPLSALFKAFSEAYEAEDDDKAADILDDLFFMVNGLCLQHQITHIEIAAFEQQDPSYADLDL